MTSVNAQLLSDTIYCDEMEFTYTSRAPNITATFAVIWGQSKPLDNPDNIHVLIYRCKEMATNCGMCLSLDEKYQCGWCQVRLTFGLQQAKRSDQTSRNILSLILIVRLSNFGTEAKPLLLWLSIYNSGKQSSL